MSTPKETGAPDDAFGGAIAWMARNPVAGNIVAFTLLVSGLLSVLLLIRREVYPAVQVETVTINLAYPGADPEVVERGAILAVEEAVADIEEIVEVRSFAAQGGASVRCELEQDADVPKIRDEIEQAVSRITSFPADVERPEVAAPEYRSEVITLTFHGDVEEDVLRQQAENAERALLQDIRIPAAEISGIRPREVHVDVPQEALERHDLTLGEVAQRIREASRELGAGGVRTRGGEVLLRIDERKDGAAIGDIVLKATAGGGQLRVRNLGAVEDGFADVTRLITFGLEEHARAIRLDLYSVGESDPLEVAQAVKAWHAEHAGSMPPGVTVSLWDDESRQFRERVELLGTNGFYGLLIVLVVLALFLEPKVAFWVTFGIPLSFAGALMLMPWTDTSINMVSLFAFLVTLGIVVDDAIVVGEAAHDAIEEGGSRETAAIRGAKRVASPVIFSVLTTCVAFAPLLFLPTAWGENFANIPRVAIAVLLFSLFESLLILPGHLGHRMPLVLRVLIGVFRLTDPLRRVLRRGLTAFVAGPYVRALRAMLAARYLVLATSLALFLVCVAVAFGGTLRVNFLPQIEGDFVFVRLRMPEGTPVQETRARRDQLIEGARAAFSGSDEIKNVQARVGYAFREQGDHLVSIYAELAPSAERSRSAGDIARAWREATPPIAGAEKVAFGSAGGFRAGADVDVELAHQDPAYLEAAASWLVERLRSFDAVETADTGFRGGQQQLSYTLDARGRALGLTPADFGRQLRHQFFGAEALRQQRGPDEVRVYVRRPEVDRRSLEGLENARIRTPSGAWVPIGEVATARSTNEAARIERVAGRRVTEVTAEVDEALGTADAIQEELEASVYPELQARFPGVVLRPGTSGRSQVKLLGAMKQYYLLALLVMFGMLAVAFKRWLQPLFVLIAIPLGFIGVVAGHLLFELDISLMSGMGFVALSGVVVNDSLVLIVAINEARERGAKALEAVMVGCTTRFRPILLTTLTTFAGLLPMVFETSTQARFLVPMAVALSFGVLAATIITLVVVPAMYLAGDDMRRLGARAGAWLGARGLGDPEAVEERSVPELGGAPGVAE
ncbi:MAG: efflux RND transporter permease subunit [Myxococcota bacterium]